MNLNQIKYYIVEYAKDYEEGRLSSEEYKELLAGLDLSNAIAESAAELEEKEQLNVYINSTINILSAV